MYYDLPFWKAWFKNKGVEICFPESLSREKASSGENVDKG
jgi:predicted nucleotide-binding protein (sugar kinase/HSP70/actin superfamily)